MPYLDYNATTPLHPDVISELNNATSSLFGNPASLHAHGRAALEAVESARSSISQHLGISSDTIYFTSGATEANNWVLQGIYQKSIKDKTPCHIIISAIEHSSIRITARELEKRGVLVTTIPVTKAGIIQIDLLKDAITPNTKLISVMIANNEIGTIQPLKEIIAIAQETRILVHTDAVQSLGKMTINLQTLGVDFASFSAHKVYGPKGIGALYIKDANQLSPFSLGGGHESGLRAGTHNTLGIIGFGKTIDLANTHLPKWISHQNKLKSQLLEGLIKQNIPHHINGDPATTIPNTLNILFPNKSGAAIMMNLDLEGISISTGSACSTGSIEPSHVIQALGYSDKDATSAIRISWGVDTTKDDIDILLKSLSLILSKL